jgi:uncharacterized membrane protein
MAHIRRNLLAGMVTVIPIMVTFFVFSFFLNLLSGIGRPKVIILANAVRPLSPDLARWILDVPWLSSSLAILLTLLMLYGLGWAVTHLVGRRMLARAEDWLKRIPFVTTVYGASKKLVEAFQTDGVNKSQKVVLIEFPHSEMKAVGFGIGIPVSSSPPSMSRPRRTRRAVISRLFKDRAGLVCAMTFVIRENTRTTAPATIRFTRGRTGRSNGSVTPMVRPTAAWLRPVRVC